MNRSVCDRGHMNRSDCGNASKKKSLQKKGRILFFETLLRNASNKKTRSNKKKATSLFVCKRCLGALQKKTLQKKNRSALFCGGLLGSNQKKTNQKKRSLQKIKDRSIKNKRPFFFTTIFFFCSNDTDNHYTNDGIQYDPPIHALAHPHIHLPTHPS